MSISPESALKRGGHPFGGLHASTGARLRLRCLPESPLSCQTIPQVEICSNVSQMKLPTASSTNGKGGSDSAPKLQGFESNPQLNVGPPLWRAFRDSLAHLYPLSLP